MHQWAMRRTTNDVRIVNRAPDLVLAPAGVILSWAIDGGHHYASLDFDLPGRCAGGGDLRIRRYRRRRGGYRTGIVLHLSRALCAEPSHQPLQRKKPADGTDGVKSQWKSTCEEG